MKTTGPEDTPGKRLEVLRGDCEDKSHSKSVEAILPQKVKAHDGKGETQTFADTGSCISSSCECCPLAVHPLELSLMAKTLVRGGQCGAH